MKKTMYISILFLVGFTLLFINKIYDENHIFNLFENDTVIVASSKKITNNIELISEELEELEVNIYIVDNGEKRINLYSNFENTFDTSNIGRPVNYFDFQDFAIGDETIKIYIDASNKENHDQAIKILGGTIVEKNFNLPSMDDYETQILFLFFFYFIFISSIYVTKSNKEIFILNYEGYGKLKTFVTLFYKMILTANLTLVVFSIIFIFNNFSAIAVKSSLVGILLMNLILIVPLILIYILEIKTLTFANFKGKYNKYLLLFLSVSTKLLMTILLYTSIFDAVQAIQRYDEVTQREVPLAVMDNLYITSINIGDSNFDPSEFVKPATEFYNYASTELGAIAISYDFPDSSNEMPVLSNCNEQCTFSVNTNYALSQNIEGITPSNEEIILYLPAGYNKEEFSNIINYYNIEKIERMETKQNLQLLNLNDAEMVVIEQNESPFIVFPNNLTESEGNFAVGAVVNSELYIPVAADQINTLKIPTELKPFLQFTNVKDEYISSVNYWKNSIKTEIIRSVIGFLFLVFLTYLVLLQFLELNVKEFSVKAYEGFGFFNIFKTNIIMSVLISIFPLTNTGLIRASFETTQLYLLAIILILFDISIMFIIYQKVIIKKITKYVKGGNLQ